MRPVLRTSRSRRHPWHKRILFAAVAQALVLCLLAPARVDATTDFKVRYRSAKAVYLDGGTVAGLAVGDRLEIVRDDTVIARVEVAFASEHSASCTVLSKAGEIQLDDRARLVKPAQGAGTDRSPRGPTVRVRDNVSDCLELRSDPHSGATSLDCIVRGSTGTVTDTEGSWRKLTLGDGRQGWVDARFIEPVITSGSTPKTGDATSETETPSPSTLEPSAGVAEAESAHRPEPREKAPRAQRRGRTRVSGSVTIDWEDFSDQSEDPFDYQQLSSRLSLRVKEIGGSPYSLRVRLRSREYDRGYVSRNTGTERQDRFYELSLAYEPSKGLFDYRVGRISTSPIVSSGHMDGALGSVSISRSFALGGFFGARSDIEQLGFESNGQIYGAFARFASPSDSGSNLRYDVVAAGTRENGQTDVSREFISLQARLSSGATWSLYQRAELDLNRGWREELTGTSSQLSNFSLTAMRRISDRSRLTLSYDRYEQYRTEENRSIPDELFNGLMRQGLRASFQLGRPRTLNVTFNAGLRTQDDDAEDTLSYGLSVRHPDVASLNLSMAANVMAFSNPFNEGWIATLSSTKRFRQSSQVSLSLGNRFSSSVLADRPADLSTQWARLGAWIELPRNLFLNSEYEITTGDEYEGERLSLGFGYRF